jgi:hypothetical protein
MPSSFHFIPSYPLDLILSTCPGGPQRAWKYGQGVCQFSSIRCDEEEPGDYFGSKGCSSGGYEEGYITRPTIFSSREVLIWIILLVTGVDVTSPPSKMTMLSLAFDTEFRTAIEKVSTQFLLIHAWPSHAELRAKRSLVS